MSKRVFKKVFVLLAAVCITLSMSLSVSARDATSYTYTLSERGEWELIQDAYMPAGTLLQDEGLNVPEDIFCYNGSLYIADTGNGRVLRYDLIEQTSDEIAKGLFNTPTGVFVNELGIFVADRGTQEAYWLDFNGEIVKRYPRPESYAYGANTVYLPEKIAADSKGNVYVLSAGTYQGLVQFDDSGEFVGFFAANSVRLTFTQWLQNVFFTEEQKSKLFNITPTGFNNLTIHPEDDLVYSLTPQNLDGVKLHSVAGGNILADYSGGERRYEDIALGNGQKIYVTTASGIVYVYSGTGVLLYSFGGQATAVDMAGYATVVSGIAVDQSDCVYLLDRHRGFVHTYIPTDFSRCVFAALECFDEGSFGQGSAYWSEVLKMAPDFLPAFNAMAVSSMQTGDYESALTYYRRANDRSGYSQAKWELRNEWFNRSFGTIIVGVVLVYIVFKIIVFILKRTGRAKIISEKLSKLGENRTLAELGHVMYTIKHPVDTWFYIKRCQRCSVQTALLIYAASFAVFIWDQAGKGFIFNNMNIMYVSPIYFAAIFILPLALWVVCSYMVSAVMYGEGRLKSVFISGAYMLSPYLVFMPVVNLLSYVLTENESFVISFATAAIWGYVLILLYFCTKEINNYSVKRTFGSIAVSLFFIVVVVIAFSIVYMLCNEFIEMLITIIKEAVIRA